LLDTESAAVYSPPGYLLFSRDGAIVAQPFDAARLQLTGSPNPIAQVAVAERSIDLPEFSTSPRPVPGFALGFTVPLLGAAVFSTSQNGVLSYAVAEPLHYQFTWVDRHGAGLGDVGPPGPMSTFDLSSDAKRLVVTRARIDRANLWLVDLERNVSSQITFGPSFEFDPRWGPDRQSVVVTAVSEDAGRRILEIGVNGKRSILLENAFVDSWSPDGASLLYRDSSGLGLFSLKGGRPPVPIRLGGVCLDQARFSPDGRWVAYHSCESPSWQVYIERFPPTGERWQVSADGGVQPMWRRDSGELYYLGLNGTIFGVEFHPEPTVRMGTPRALFRVPMGPVNAEVEQYATVDGSRFLLRKAVGRPQRPVSVVVNWSAFPKEGSPH
jgi:hypothetical protein